jgi:hypothetical protein
MIQAPVQPTLLQPIRQPEPRLMPARSERPAPLTPKPLVKDSLELKTLAAGALAGTTSVYMPTVAGSYGMGAKTTLLDSLKAPLLEKSTLALIGGAALTGGIAGSVAGRNARNTGEALTSGAMVGVTVGALGGAAVAMATKVMTPAQGALRGAMLGGFSGAAGGAGAYLLGERK